MHNHLTREFGRALSRIERLAHLVEETLGNRAADLDADLTAATEDVPEAERQDFFEFHAEDFFELSHELPTILRYSVLTAADSVLEHYLTATCRMFAELRKMSIEVNDLAGSGVRRAQNYLKKVACMQFPDNKRPWPAIVRLYELRNCIVHADGYVPELHDALLRWLDGCTGIRLSAGRIVALEVGFTSVALDWYNSFATDFDSACAPLGLWEAEFPLMTPSEDTSDLCTWTVERTPTNADRVLPAAGRYHDTRGACA